MDYYFNSRDGFYIHRQEKKKQIKKLGLLMGGAFLSYVVMQNVIYLIFEFLGLTASYDSDPVYQSAVDTILVCVSLLLPFYIFGKKIKKVSLVQEPLSLDRPEKITVSAVAVLAGVGVCMFSNIITSYLTAIMEAVGITLESPNIAMPSGVAGVIITIVRIVLCAAMTEEISLRGYVMGNLRPYGDKFAILMSSVLFAAMHGNLVQAPFALIAGFAIGYFSIKTGSIWTGIIIHALNNGISVAISYASETMSEESATIIAAALIYGFIFTGGFALLLFNMMTKDRKLTDNCAVLTMREKCSAFILNPAMIISLAYMVYITSFYVKIG